MGILGSLFSGGGNKPQEAKLKELQESEPLNQSAFQELVASVNKIEISEVRTNLPELLVVVVEGDNLTALRKSLEPYFKGPLKAAGEFPVRDVRKLADPYGGIMKDQTFYYAKAESGIICAMEWPWQGQDKTTVKIIYTQNAS